MKEEKSFGGNMSRFKDKTTCEKKNYLIYVKSCKGVSFARWETNFQLEQEVDGNI